MAQVQIADVVVPAEFTAYQVENSMVSTALYQSGVAVPNGEMDAQLQAGAESFTVPFWVICRTLKPTSPATIRPSTALRRKSPLQSRLCASRSFMRHGLKCRSLPN